MTTANLSVALRTDKAREALEQLRQQIAQGMGTTAIRVDAAALAADLKKRLEAEEINLKINIGSLRKQLTQGVGAAIAEMSGELSNKIDKAVGKERSVSVVADLKGNLKLDLDTVKQKMEDAQLRLKKFRSELAMLQMPDPKTGKVAELLGTDLKAFKGYTEGVRRENARLQRLMAERDFLSKPMKVSAMPDIAQQARASVGKVKYDVEVQVTEASLAAMSLAVQKRLSEGGPYEIRVNPEGIKQAVIQHLKGTLIDLHVNGGVLRESIRTEAAGLSFTPVQGGAAAGVKVSTSAAAEPAVAPRPQQQVENVQINNLTSAINDLIGVMNKSTTVRQPKKTATEAFNEEGKLTKGDPQPRYSISRSAKREDGTTLRMSQAQPRKDAEPELERLRDEEAGRADLAEKQKISNETFRARKAARRYEDQQERSVAADLQQVSNETFRARRAARRYEQKQETEAASEMQRVSNETFRARKAARRYEDQQEKAAASELQQVSNETFRARRAARRYEQKQETEAASEMQRVSNETFRARKAARRYEDQQEKAAASELQQVSNETFRSRRVAARFEDSAATKDSQFKSGGGAETDQQKLTYQLRRLRQAQDLINDGRSALAVQLFGKAVVAAVPDIDTFQKKLDSARLSNEGLKTSADSAAVALRNEMGALYNSAKFKAADTYEGRGVKVAGARELANKYGEERTRGFLGRDSGLVDEIANVERFKRSVDALTSSLKEEMGAIYNSAKFKAAEQYDGRGVKVAGTKALLDKYDQGTVRSFLGKDQGLIEQVPNLPNFAKVGDAANVSREQVKRWKEAANESHSAARGLAGSLGMLWTTWGSTIPLVAAAGIGAAMRGVYEEGKRVEYQLAFVKGLSGTTLATTDFESAVKGSMFGSKDAADGLRALTQSGLGAKEALSALPDVLALATVGETSVAEAAFAATGVVKAFGLSMGDLGRVSDVLAKGAAASNASVGDMMEALKYASAASSLYGEKLEETAASVAVLSEKNIKGSMAGTAHMNLLKEIYTPTDKASKAFKALGIDLQEMQRAGLSSADMIDKIREKTSKLDSTSLRSFTAAVGGERGNRELAPLLEAGTTSVRDMQAKLEQSSGFTRQVMTELADTVEASQNRIKQSFSFSFSKVFDESRGSIQAFNDALASAVGSEAFQQTLRTISQGVINLTRSLVEHADLIQAVAVAYGTLKVVGTVASSIERMTVSLTGSTAAAAADAAALRTWWAAATAKTVAVEAGTLATAASVPVTTAHAAATAASGVASTAAAGATAMLGRAAAVTSTTMAALGAATRLALGPLGLLVTVGTTLWTVWELVGSKTDSAREAQERYNNKADNTIRLLDQEIERLERKAKLRANEGKTETQVTIDSERDKLKAYVANVEDKAAVVNKGYVRGRTFTFEDESGKNQTYSDKDIQRLAEGIGGLKQKLSKIEERSVKTATLQVADDKAEAVKSMTAWIDTTVKGLEARKAAFKGDAKAISEVDKAIKALGQYKSPEVLATLRNTRDVDARKDALKKYADAGGVKQTFGGKADTNDKTAIQERKDALAASKYQKQILEEQERRTKLETDNKGIKLKTWLKTGLIDKEGAYTAEERLDQDHFDATVDARKKYNDDLAKLVRTSLKSGAVGADEDLVDFMRRKIKEGADRGEDPTDVVGSFLKSTKDKEGRTVYDKMQPSDVMTAVNSISANREDTEALRVKLAEKRSAHEEEIRDAQRDSDVKFQQFLQKLRDDSSREVFKDIARLGDLEGTELNQAGPGAMSEMFPKSYIEGLDNRGLTQAAAQARLTQREAKRRGNFVADQERKLYAGSKPVGRVARDESRKAGLQEYDRVMPEIQGVQRNIGKLTAELEDQLNKRRELAEQTTEASAIELAAVDKSIENKLKEISVEKERKQALEDTMAVNVENRMKVAGAIAEEQRSSQYGMRNFWQGYQDAAEDNARTVSSIMGQSFSSMEAGLMRFTTTGKANFKDFTRSMLADAARIAQSAIIRKLLTMGVNYLIGSFGGGATDSAGASMATGGTNGIALNTIGNDATLSANGNVMTSSGPMKLNMYANGGIARSPQLSIFGEGRTPEAYVPLPDGRSIPVTLSGDAGMGGGGTTVNSNVYVTVAADGGTKVTSDASNAQAEALGRMVEGAVTGIIVREKRPGGLLYQPA